MTRSILGLAAALAVALIVPSTAAAHTGAVSCNEQGVTFTYSNFADAPGNTITELVGNSVVPFSFDGPSGSNTVPLQASSMNVSASWDTNGHQGSIPPTTLSCPYTPPPAPTCPAGTTPESVVTNGVLICIRTITQTVTVPGPVTQAPAQAALPAQVITNTVTQLVKAKLKKPKCPKYTKQLSWKKGVLVCGKRVIRMVPFKPVKQPKKGVKGRLVRGSAGVTG